MRNYIKKLIVIGTIIASSFFIADKVCGLEDIVNKTKTEEVKEQNKRSFKIDETLIFTDKTKANTLKLFVEKKYTNFEDKILISYDILGQKEEEKTNIKINRLEFNYKLYSNSSKEPFAEFYYSSDQPTKVNWKVLAGGMGRKLPFDLKLEIGYGYKWGKITEKEVYQYDVVTFNLNNKKKISNFNTSQNFKTITPRNIKDNKQPIYDFLSSISTPIAKNLDGTINFNCRYQKTPQLKKEDWFNYTIKFGITYIPIK